MYKMKKCKLLIVMVITIMGAVSLCGCASSNDDEITGAVIDKFMELTQIPRPSTHEKQVSDYLKGWAEDQGFDTVQDEYNNLIIQLPATEGMEDKPLVILQGHMDMVFAQGDDMNLDPLTSKIEVVNDGETLKSDGKTSLGGDDGIGVAIMECVAEGKMSHGPLRLIITTDEEDGMSGAKGLDKKWVKDAEYMINLDDELEGEIVISSASHSGFEFSKEASSENSKGNMGLEIKVKGLTGGHSGDEIHKGRLNGILALGKVLDNLKKSDIDYQLNSMEGGTATNAIPASAKAIICIDKKDMDKVNRSCDKTLDQLKKDHKDTDPDMTIEVSKSKMIDKALSQSDLECVLDFCQNLMDGVYTMSKDIEGLVESSSNLGIVKIDADSISLQGSYRSSSVAMRKEINALDKKLAASLNMKFTSDDSANAWPAKKDNSLRDLAADKYKEIFSEDLNVIAIHAGLECGEFADANPDLNIISMGPTVKDPHSVNETIEIQSIAKVWKLLEGILAGI